MSIIKPNWYLTFRHEWHPEPGLRVIPDTTTIKNEPIGTRPGKGDRIPVLPAAIAKLYEINTERAANWCLKPGAAWVNTKYAAGETPRAESISFGGNFAKILEERNGYYRLATFRYDRADFPGNWFTSPWLFWKASCVDENLVVSRPLDGIDAYAPFIATKEMWILAQQVEVFPKIPPIIGLPVVRNSDGKTIRIFDYTVRGASVLGLTASGRWTYLKKSTKPGEREFPTSWTLSTFGVISPV